MPAAYMSSPCHIELILSEKEEPVKKEVISEIVDSVREFENMRKMLTWNFIKA